MPRGLTSSVGGGRRSDLDGPGSGQHPPMRQARTQVMAQAQSAAGTPLSTSISTPISMTSLRGERIFRNAGQRSAFRPRVFA